MPSPKAAPIGRRVRVRNVATGDDLADSDRVGALLRPVVDARLEGLLLLALSGAAGRQGARSGAVGPGDLLPPRRHAAVRRRPDLSAPGSSRRGSSTRRSATTGGTCSSARFAAPTTTTSCTSSISATPRSRPSPRRSSRSSKRSTPNTRRSATTRRASTCAPTRTRRTAGSSPSISKTPSPAPGRSWFPSSRTRSKTPRSSAAASSIHSLVDVQSRIQLFGLDGALEGDIPLPGVGAVSASVRTIGSVRRLVHVQLAAVAGDGLSLRPRVAIAHGVRGAAAADRRVAVRDARDVCDVEGRHARAVLPDEQEGPAAATAATRRCSTDTAASRSACCPSIDPTCRRGSSSAACSSRSTCAAAPSTARRGTRRGISRRSRTCSTTSSRSPSTW